MDDAVYRSRGVQQAFPDRASHKVTILEGRRAVGKTTLARHLEARGTYASYASLTDPSTRSRASADPGQWLRSLERPAVIDEAQLVPELSTAVKDLVDVLPEDHHFLLTGSASVGRATMGASDPLAGRSTRIRLHPFTAAELTTEAGQVVPSLVDILFDGDLTHTSLSTTSREDLTSTLRRGGIPSYSLSSLPLTRRALEARAQADALALVDESLAPGERINPGTARRVLDAVLRTPGGLLNRTRLAEELAISIPTVTRYLDILERRFLVWTLPNLRPGAARSGRAVPKIHPADTSTTCESLSRAGHDIGADPELLGQTLESWIAVQLVASLGWSTVDCSPFFWRDPKNHKEVDVVLLDGTGRRVGIEVKLARSVSHSDLTGLRALAGSRPGGTGLHRGFVVYSGDRFEQVDDRIWALPVSAFSHPELLVTSTADTDRPTGTHAQENVEIMTVTPPGGGRAAASGTPVFLSYVHDDDDYLDGLLTAFAREIAAACTYDGVPIDLVIDTDVLRWGHSWKERLRAEVDRTAFLLPMVTPRYITSAACLDEFMRFRARASDLGYDGLLTLLVKDPGWDRTEVATDPTVRLVREDISRHQWLTTDQPLEDLVQGSPEYKRAARSVARSLVERVRERDMLPMTGGSRAGSTLSSVATEAEDDADGLVEVLERLHEDRLPQVEATLTELGRAFAGLAETLARSRTFPAGATPTSAALVRLAADVEPQRVAVEDATSAASEAWASLDHDLQRLIQGARGAGLVEQADEMATDLAEMAAGLRLTGLDQFTAQVASLAALSRALRPTARTLEHVVDLLRAVHRSARAWDEAR